MVKPLPTKTGCGTVVCQADGSPFRANPSKTSRGRAAARVALVFYVALLCLYSVARPATPGLGVIAWLPGGDLAAHCMAYAGLVLILCIALAGRRPSKWPTALLAVAFGLTLGGALELVQAFRPWRTCSLADFTANIVGMAVASGSWSAWRPLSAGGRASSGRARPALMGKRGTT
jgi:VanZ family protein